jgi:hypothetical protein
VDEQRNMDENYPNDTLNAKMAHAAAREAEMDRVAKMSINNAPGNELTRLNATIESLYAQKCQQMQDLRARHAEERVRAHNDHERHHDELVRRAAQAMRDMDDRQHAEMAPLHELIRRLEEMRS